MSWGSQEPPPLPGPDIPNSSRCPPSPTVMAPLGGSSAPRPQAPGSPVGLERGGRGAGSEGRAEGGTMAPSPPMTGWRVGSPRPASPLLPRQGDEVIAPRRGTRSRCPARSLPAPLPRRPPPPTSARPRTPGPTMTERCSLWSALSAAACCFYRGSFVQVQVRGRLGSRQALRAETPAAPPGARELGAAARWRLAGSGGAGAGAAGGGGVAPASPLGAPPLRRVRVRLPLPGLAAAGLPFRSCLLRRRS